MNGEVVIDPVEGKRGRALFVDTGRRFASREPHAVPQLRGEQLELVDPAKNPFFGHAAHQLFVARRGDAVVGRISAHIDRLALELPRQQGFGPGAGMFGYFDAADEAVAHALLRAAEDWLRGQGMDRAIGPISMSIWEEPGLLVSGQDHAPMIMMGHHPEIYQHWIESAGYARAKTLLTYDLDVTVGFPPLIRRIVQSGQRNERISLRPVDLSRWDEEVETILAILNDAWSNNWGFIPFTNAEIAYAGKKLKPIIHPQINLIAEVDGKPVAFMLTLPDINDVLRKVNGRLWPLGWLRLLRWMRKPSGAGMRVPLMGVRRELHNSRLASQLAFMMISQIREVAIAEYQTKRAEIGWILDDNQGMKAIADAIGSTVNREYAIYERSLAS
ncbi:MAG TPA: N-acetyltransferase [Erythrobacter sp.]|jgi:GNAT superfamily N-acetyltransferase|uniref:N-acetyltransferase n=1 Tax=Qipengyuania citrea TaxID=225971 RepID=A0A6I4UCL2_9SPHN|nr:N-acetyltransferase [Qipengyuania citrea]HAN89685.1 N-acetyltransferase [Erythrobacter sp.]MDQ0566978.1 GNAT superfamily N-acetyltransferase [Qipengyuania citrea]MXP36680.1 N-acetyltransferase [Qipengyuania citrea]HBM72744.1 N-acetyltransferase [Erythrobacter sp.]HCJ80996.1 N-acetyltransferase [Erythrobacter sp.]|tara:strand:- start:560 stop:1720 length:1161 start_codon:yes stop_codon:yes gene_type:complete